MLPRVSVRETGQRLVSRRRRSSSDGPQAVYARVLDGEHVWLAVTRADELLARGPDGATVPIPSEPGRDGDEPVAVARFAVADAFAGDDRPDLQIDLLARVGRAETPVLHAAHRRSGPMHPGTATRDGRWRYAVAERRGAVVVERRAVPPAVAVLGFAEHPDGALVRLDTGADAVALVREDGSELTTLPLADGAVVIGAVGGIAPGETVRLEVGGLHVVRRANLLNAPHPGTLLPPLPGDLELRWGGAGRLAVHHRSEPVS